MRSRTVWRTALASLGLICTLALRAQEPASGAAYTDEVRQFTVTAPAGWELFPEEELPENLAALFYQVGPDGQQTGASMIVRVYGEQVHSELDLQEFVGLHQLNVRSMGLETEDIARHEYGKGLQTRISLEYTVEEEGEQVWYRQMFYRVGVSDVLMLSAKDLAAHREKSVGDLNEIFDSVRIQNLAGPEPSPEPLDLPTPSP